VSEAQAAAPPVADYAFAGGSTGYTALAAADGVAHPLWIDTRDLGGRKQEIFAARISTP